MSKKVDNYIESARSHFNHAARLLGWTIFNMIGAYASVSKTMTPIVMQIGFITGSIYTGWKSARHYFAGQIDLTCASVTAHEECHKNTIPDPQPNQP